MTFSRPTALPAGLLAWLLLFAESASGQETPEVEPPAADTGAAEAWEPESDDPFAGFETHFLSNGVKVWFKHLPGAPNVSVSAGVPVGSDADPPGKEQLAHFTEHMLFSDHDGRSEQEIKDAVESLGGQRNGFTYRDHTWYYVTIGQEHGLFAVEWLAGILSPHEMDPAVVDRGRQPVENEIRAQPRELFDHLWAALNPAWLAPPDFWEREFGIERLRAPFPDMWRSLQRITPEDLSGFYDQYYSPSVMTVTIVGDLDRGEVLEQAQRTFGSIPARPVTRWATAAEDPGRGRITYHWGFQSTAQYQSRHKLFYATADELLTAFLHPRPSEPQAQPAAALRRAESRLRGECQPRDARPGCLPADRQPHRRGRLRLRQGGHRRGNRVSAVRLPQCRGIRGRPRCAG